MEIDGKIYSRQTINPAQETNKEWKQYDGSGNTEWRYLRHSK